MRKIVILGDPNVGKTSIRQRYLGKGFQTSYLPTMGADFSVSTITRDNFTLELQIWDIAGQSSFGVLMPRFLSMSHAALIVFDLTRKDTFDNTRKWLEKFKENNEEKFSQTPIYILGNKEDLDHQTIDDDTIEEYVNQISLDLESDEKITWFKTSALTGNNINLIFERLTSHFISDITI